MHFRWTVKSYQFMRPVLGHRLAMWVSDMLPVALFAGIPLALFVALSFLPTKEDGSRHGSCGSGPGQYDC